MSERPTVVPLVPRHPDSGLPRRDLWDQDINPGHGIARALILMVMISLALGLPLAWWIF